MGWAQLLHRRPLQQRRATSNNSSSSMQRRTGRSWSRSSSSSTWHTLRMTLREGCWCTSMPMM